MASGTFMMDPVALQQIGGNFQRFSREYANDMKSLRSYIEDLGTCWKSEDYRKFSEIYEQNAEVIDQMSKAFESFGEILTTTGSLAKKNSQELRSTFK